MLKFFSTYVMSFTSMEVMKEMSWTLRGELASLSMSKFKILWLHHETYVLWPKSDSGLSGVPGRPSLIDSS